MKIKWYGHASFIISDSAGRSVITDPYTPETSGYQPIPDVPDVVLTSSLNDDFHDRSDLILGDPQRINMLDVAREGGEIEAAGLLFKGIESSEMYEHPYHEPDKCAMYRWEMDGIQIGHMGDVGNPFTPEEYAFFAGIDVFLALAGDVPTIRLPDLKRVIDRVAPRLVIPMHFRTLRYKPRNMQWITAFLHHFNDADIDFQSDWEVELSVADLPESTRVLVLTHAL
ncbi:MAG: MBL fold metallo-hydrolase [Chloroflexi bacterium]|nr:MBL fold metallo-hydrolase [Chloroflexota bacterium]